jgi:hypothetical protein
VCNKSKKSPVAMPAGFQLLGRQRLGGSWYGGVGKRDGGDGGDGVHEIPPPPSQLIYASVIPAMQEA